MKPSRKARDAAGGKSFDGFSLPPHAIVVIGVDTQDGPEHPLYSQRAVDLDDGRVDYDDRMYRSIRTKGVLQPIRVRLEPIGENGDLVHVVVAGRHRVLYGRRAVSEMFAAGEIKDMKSWQIKCTLEHAKTAREMIEIVADENVCRRVLGDDEIAEGIARGLNIGLTLDEMADRYNISTNKAKRLLARAEGVVQKPRKEKPERVPAKVINEVVEHLRNGAPIIERTATNADVASLIDVVRGRVAMADASPWVRAMFSVAESWELAE